MKKRVSFIILSILILSVLVSCKSSKGLCDELDKSKGQKDKVGIVEDLGGKTSTKQALAAVGCLVDALVEDEFEPVRAASAEAIGKIAVKIKVDKDEEIQTFREATPKILQSLSDTESVREKSIDTLLFLTQIEELKDEIINSALKMADDDDIPSRTGSLYFLSNLLSTQDEDLSVDISNEIIQAFKNAFEEDTDVYKSVQIAGVIGLGKNKEKSLAFLPNLLQSMGEGNKVDAVLLETITSTGEIITATEKKTRDESVKQFFTILVDFIKEERFTERTYDAFIKVSTDDYSVNLALESLYPILKNEKDEVASKAIDTAGIIIKENEDLVSTINLDAIISVYATIVKKKSESLSRKSAITSLQSLGKLAGKATIILLEILNDPSYEEDYQTIIVRTISLIDIEASDVFGGFQDLFVDPKINKQIKTAIAKELATLENHELKIPAIEFLLPGLAYDEEIRVAVRSTLLSYEDLPIESLIYALSDELLFTEAKDLLIEFKEHAVSTLISSIDIDLDGEEKTEALRAEVIEILSTIYENKNSSFDKVFTDEDMIEVILDKIDRDDVFEFSKLLFSNANFLENSQAILIGNLNNDDIFERSKELMINSSKHNSLISLCKGISDADYYNDSQKVELLKEIAKEIIRSNKKESVPILISCNPDTCFTQNEELIVSLSEDVIETINEILLDSEITDQDLRLYALDAFVWMVDRESSTSQLQAQQYMISFLKESKEKTDFIDYCMEKLLYLYKDTSWSKIKVDAVLALIEKLKNEDLAGYAFDILNEINDSGANDQKCENCEMEFNDWYEWINIIVYPLDE